MARKEGDPCPHCGEGRLTVDPNREIRENADGGTVSHRTWLCDKCGKQTKDFDVGMPPESVGNISDTVTRDVKTSFFDRFRRK